MINRRSFLKALASLGVFVLTPLKKLTTFEPSPSKSNNLRKGELFEGFLLLEKDALLPDFVDFPPNPIMGHISEEEDSPKLESLKGKTLYFENIETLQAHIKTPVFMPNPKFSLQFTDCCATVFARSGKVWEARYSFNSENHSELKITFLVRQDFPRPYPVWPVMDLVKVASVVVEDEEPTIAPEKIDFAPSKGILLPVDRGYMVQWIKQNVLYTVIVENQAQREFTEGFISSLIEK